MGAVKNLCKRGIVLNQGLVAFDGGVEEAVNYYTSNSIIDSAWHKQICDLSHLNPAKNIQFLSIEFAKKTNEFASNETIELLFNIYAHKSINKARINLTIFSIDGIPIGSVSSKDLFSIEFNQSKKISICIISPKLTPGTYTISFSTGIGDHTTCQTNFDIAEHALSLNISTLSKDRDLELVQWNNSWGRILFEYTAREII